MTYKVGDKFPIWFPPHARSVKVDGYYMADIIDVRPYTGRYKEFFTQIVRIPAWRTGRGWIEISA